MEITETAAKVLSDDELISAVSENVHGAAFFSRVTHYDRNCDVLYKEAIRRGNEDLYTRGYKRAERQLL